MVVVAFLSFIGDVVIITDSLLLRDDISQLKTRLARLIDSKFVPVAAACSISACWCLASTKRLGHC
ncbi:hypothetical protein Csa_004434 [Cucumis sativus]|uniref:Uncharacterized protein n=1 Tax=Cucumis sativus TaxID=3659 RepID=A0A0A0KHL7_CUCSA|nr:hypothetical protein Csa_004434 [Cucumis sativus]